MNECRKITEIALVDRLIRNRLLKYMGQVLHGESLAGIGVKLRLRSSWIENGSEKHYTEVITLVEFNC
jgi:hypothetical protein